MASLPALTRLLMILETKTAAFNGILIPMPSGTNCQQCSMRLPLSNLRSLEEIHLSNSYDINDIKATADNLEKLERHDFGFADIDDIILFIKRARNLRKIRVFRLVRSEASGMKRTESESIHPVGKDRILTRIYLKTQKVTIYHR